MDEDDDTEDEVASDGCQLPLARGGVGSVMVLRSVAAACGGCALCGKMKRTRRQRKDRSSAMLCAGCAGCTGSLHARESRQSKATESRNWLPCPDPMQNLNKRASFSLFVLFSPQLCSSFLTQCGALDNRRSSSKLPPLLLDMSSPSAASASTSSSLPHVQQPCQQSVTIDYSAANEYMDAHYRYIYPDGSPYFDAAKEDIFNARRGYIIDEEGAGGIGTTSLLQPSLERCGFELVRLEEGEDDDTDPVSDWTDTDQAVSKYLPKLRQAIIRAFSGNGNDENGGGSAISHVLFYQPMLRGEKVEMGTKTSPVASLVHIDTDIGAHDTEGMVRLVERNQIVATGGGDGDETIFPRKELIGAINKGARFAIVNAWRGLSSDGKPVGRAHLGLLSPQYGSDQNLPRRHRCYPALRPKRPQSRWYTYPQMEHDEILLFKQYDRRVDRVSDLWHCALPVFPGEEESPPRMSFDCRALVVFENDMVPKDIDRYCDDRLKPSLTLEESGCFCDEQADKRKDG